MRVSVSTGSRLSTGLHGSGPADPFTTVHWGRRRPFTRSSTGAASGVNGLSPTILSVTCTERSGFAVSTFQSVVPCGGRVNGPVRRRVPTPVIRPFPELAPVFSDLEREHEGASLQRYRIPMPVRSPYAHRKLERYPISFRPFSFHRMKRPRSRSLLAALVYRDCRAPRPGGNSQPKRELHCGSRVDLEMDLFVKRILRLFRNRNRHASAHDRLYRARGVDHGCKSAVRRRHPQARGEFRPSLMHVRRAAAKIRFQPEEIGLGTVCGPVSRLTGKQHLIRLLIVLVGPHVGAERSGQRVKGDLLQPIAERWVPKNRNQVFDGKHAFDYGTQLRALRRVCARIVLIPAMHTVGKQV